MTDPYRAPFSVDMDPLLPERCVPEDVRATRCPSCLSCVALERHRSRGSRGVPFGRAMSMAATLLLLVGSASMGAITWTVTTTLLAARPVWRVAAPAVTAPAPMLAAHLARRAVRPEQSVGGLARVGLETHDPDALWTRAERLAGEDRRVTLVRATIAPDALPALGALATGAPRAHVGQLGPLAGVQVASADPGSLPALLGLRAGDVVTAIDGIPLRHPDDVKRALAVSTLARGVVIELRRGAQWVVLRLDAMHA